MGSYESGLPLSLYPGREVTSDTLLLSTLAKSFSPKVCFDLGTGTGEVLKNAEFTDTFSIGIDNSLEVLMCFDKSFGQPVLCSVNNVSSVFTSNCADLVLANPPYFSIDNGRSSPCLYRQEAREGNSLLVFRFIFAGAFLLKKGGTMLLTCTSSDIEKLKQGFRAAGFVKIEVIEKGKIIAIKADF